MRNAAISAKSWTDCEVTCRSSRNCLAAPVRWERNWIFFCRKCIAKRTRYSRRPGGGKGGAGNYGLVSGIKVGNRKIAGAGSEPRMSDGTTVEPLILIVSGPSGSGKSTLVQRILELPGTMPSVSCTTRTRRGTESSGKCYDFVTEAEFKGMVDRGEFLQYARVFGKYSYGTPKKWLEESRRKGRWTWCWRSMYKAPGR